MNNQNLIIYEFKILFDILNEIKEQLNFNLLNISKQEYSQLKMDNLENYLIISNNEDINSESQIAIMNEIIDPGIQSKIINIEEYNIGHFIIGESIFDGLSKVIKNFKKIIKK